MANPAATFVPKHRARRNWDRIRQLQVAREGAPCRIPLGEFRVVAAGRPGGRGAGR